VKTRNIHKNPEEVTLFRIDSCEHEIRRIGGETLFLAEMPKQVGRGENGIG
jgi:hypothetical protein